MFLIMFKSDAIFTHHLSEVDECDQKASFSDTESVEFKHTIDLSRDDSTLTGENYMDWEIRQTAAQHISNAKGNMWKQITTQQPVPQ